MKGELYARVILNIISDAVDRPFQYLIPPGLQEKIKIGSSVRVPFRSREITAYVVGLDKKPVVDAPREIAGLQDEGALQEELVELSYWLSRRFFSRWIEAIYLCLPPGNNKVRTKYVELILPLFSAKELLEESVNIKKKALRQSLILEHLAQAGEEGLPWNDLRKITGAGRQSLLSLINKGLVKIEKVAGERVFRDGIAASPPGKTDLRFSPQQEAVWKEIRKGFSSAPQEFLIYGVTGSGKTELYLRAAEEALSRGRTVLILVPEIALTPHIIEQFRGRFSGEFALLHSNLSAGERFEQWWRVKRGEARVVLGARSAVFAPLENIGLIVMDEEHENTYKQSDSPRYHTREAAKWRAAYNGSVLLLGSATPSLETYVEAKDGNISLLKLTERVGGRPLPAIEIVDMRQEFKERNKGIFSRKLWKAINETLLREEQVILFLNRRGFSSFQLCRQCGYVMRCPSCDISLTYHASPEHLVCHYCGYKRVTPEFCPKCKSPHIRNFGLGTQRVEKEAKSNYPNAFVMRMDSDTAVGKGAYLKILSAFREQKAAILIGTQMIAKGLDFPDVTLVGVIAADISLHLPDFRAGERTFQLLSQVAGRAGRGDKKGRVIIQTFTPWHYSIQAAAKHNYLGFIEEEYGRRRELLYPPFSEIILFNCSCPQEKKAAEAAGKLRVSLIKYLPSLSAGKEELLGPFPAPIKKINGRFRYQLLYKGANLGLKCEIIRGIVWDYKKEIRGDIRVAVDFNPLMML